MKIKMDAQEAANLYRQQLVRNNCHFCWLNALKENYKSES